MRMSTHWSPPQKSNSVSKTSATHEKISTSPRKSWRRLIPSKPKSTPPSTASTPAIIKPTSILAPTTKTPCSTSPASISRPFPRPMPSPARTTSASQRWSPTRSTISANFSYTRSSTPSNPPNTPGCGTSSSRSTAAIWRRTPCSRTTSRKPRS